MLKTLILGCVSALSLALAAVGVQAQDTLTLGDPVEGELTDRAFAVEYTYEGKADEVIVVSLARVDVFGDLDNPALVIKNENGRQVMRYDAYGNFEVVWMFPQDGTYTIVVTRTDDEAGTSIGEYTLTVTNPEELEAGASVEKRTDSDTTDYYVYRGDSDFVLSYLRDGGYTPEFTINLIETDSEYRMGQLNPIAVVGGKSVTQGAVGVIPGGEVYVVRVGTSRFLFDYYFETVTASYTLQIGAAQGN